MHRLHDHVDLVGTAQRLLEYNMYDCVHNLIGQQSTQDPEAKTKVQHELIKRMLEINPKGYADDCAKFCAHFQIDVDEFAILRDI